MKYNFRSLHQLKMHTPLHSFMALSIDWSGRSGMSKIIIDFRLTAAVWFGLLGMMSCHSAHTSRAHANFFLKKKRKVRTRSSFCLIWVMRFGAVGTESKTMCSYSVVALFWNLNLSPSVVPIAELLLLEAGISIISYSHAWRTGLYSSCQISARAVTSWWAQLLVSNLLVTDSSQRHTPTTFISVPIRVG